MSSFDVQVFLSDGRSILGDQWAAMSITIGDFEYVNIFKFILEPSCLNFHNFLLSNKFENWSGLQTVRAITALLAWIG